MVQLPKTLHEQLVLFGYGEVEGIVLGVAGPSALSVEIEEDVVEDREFVVDGGSTVADLLVQIVETSFTLGRVGLG